MPAYTLTTKNTRDITRRFM